MADTQEYQARIKSHTKDKDFIQMQDDAPRVLHELIAGVADEVLRRRPSPEKWSVVEILAHMAEDELVSSWRYRQMIEQSGCALNGFDQDEWARLGKYSEWESMEALRMFESLRNANLRVMGGLTPEEWQRYGMHAERGRITVTDLARHMAGHDVNHIEQIRKILGK